jgi:hypothetical protein
MAGCRAACELVMTTVTDSSGHGNATGRSVANVDGGLRALQHDVY